ncbi:hypothetical protein Efla_000603 [Eimeria flavescens]
MVLSGDIQELWPTGVALAFLGTFSGALGDVLVRKAFRKAQEDENDAQTAVKLRLSVIDGKTHRSDTPKFIGGQDVRLGGACRATFEKACSEEDDNKNPSLDRWWLAGMIMTAVIDPALTTLALLFAPSSIVTPFAGAHILWACLLAILLLGERMHALDVLGAGMVIGGIVVVVIYATKAGDVQTVEDFILGLAEPEAATSACLLLALVCISIFFACIKETSAAAGWWHKHVSPEGIELFGIDLKRLGVCASSGLLGGLTNTATKLLTMEITELFENPLVSLQHWGFYFSLVLSLAFAVPQLYFLYSALRHYGAVFVVPTVNACTIVSGSVAAFWILREHPRSMLTCMVGLATVTLGVALLSRPTSQSKGSQSAEDEATTSRVACSGADVLKRGESRFLAAVKTEVSCSSEGEVFERASCSQSEQCTSAAVAAEGLVESETQVEAVSQFTWKVQVLVFFQDGRGARAYMCVPASANAGSLVRVN